MTVCAAALADDSKAIVVIADKALSYGGYIQWDADATKIFSFKGNKAIALVSGSEPEITRMLKSLWEFRELGKDRGNTWKQCEQSYKQCLEEMIEASVLRPKLITRSEYIAAISGVAINSHIKSIAEAIDTFEFDCEILLCGFSENLRPYIFSLSNPGIVTDMTPTGFHAIGSGGEKAISRMLWSETKRSHPIERVLYDAFDAKANAEMAIGVGYEWDAEVMIKGKEERSAVVPKEIKDIIERAWAKQSRSPFEKREKDDLPNPPPKWKDRLREWAVSIS